MTTGPTAALDVHRLLDEAFAGVVLSPDLQDLKEEMRANLMVRVAELEAAGVPPATAARQAIAELGDVGALVREMGDGAVAPTARADGVDASAWLRHRVRPRATYVVRTVLASLVGAGALAAAVVGVLSSADVLADTVPVAGSRVAAAVAALAGGLLVADALRQETTTNYPVPRLRAGGYGLATLLALLGLAGFAQYVGAEETGWLVSGTAPVIVAVLLFAGLGATQTNRHKPWVMRLRAEHAAFSDRFERDPAAAARFGVYTVAIWMVALTACVVLGLAVGWLWSPLPLIGGGVVMMLTLARMLFAPTADGSTSPAAGRSA